jgi:hypothetical protein
LELTGSPTVTVVGVFVRFSLRRFTGACHWLIEFTDGHTAVGGMMPPTLLYIQSCTQACGII